MTKLKILFFFHCFYSCVKILDKMGYYIQITPEFYKGAINWNYQIWWYSTKDIPQVRKYLVDGTMMHGDNHEYPTREDAVMAAILHVFGMIKDPDYNKKLYDYPRTKT